MAWDGGGGGDARRLESRLTVFLGPYEPLIMKIQSLLVWEYPWKSALLFIAANLLFWFIYVSSLRFFFLVSVVLIVIVFVDTWKNRIWPEIRVPSKEPEDKDGWTPVHPRLLSVPEISTLLSSLWDSLRSTFAGLRLYRSSHPLVFCLGNTVFFTVTAVVGCHVSGFGLAYLSIMSLMLWPSVMYHSLPAKAYTRMQPGLEWLGQHVIGKVQAVVDKAREMTPSFITHLTTKEVEEEFVPQENSEVASALSGAIMDSEDDNGTSSSIATPGLSTSASFNNSEEDSLEQQEADFDLEVNQMPSFDDIDNTDDELDLSSRPVDTSVAHAIQSNLSRLSALQFNAGHFGDSESEDEHTLSEQLNFSDANNSNSNGAGVAQAQAALQNLSGAFVARTISSMMESALQGVAYLGQGQSASSSSVIPRTGAKITYTCTDGGESVDFQNPHATIPESEEEMSDLDQNEQIAEIEKDFDFLHDLE